MVPVCVSYGHGAKTSRIEALVDSGSDDTLFNASIADALKIKLEKGPMSKLGGIAVGAQIDVYYHKVKLWVGIDVVEIVAGFSRQMSVGAILGRRGFFENYSVKFDPSANPPGIEIERIGRA